ncbi:MAG: phosphate ABC transporter permease PstA [Gemmataceae bacterium]
MDDLNRVIAQRRRQDAIFNLLGIACTLVGIITLAVLLIDLVSDSLGLLRQYRKPLADVAEAQIRVVKQDGKSVVHLRLEDRDYRFPLPDDDADLLQDFVPRGELTLEGDRLFLPLGGLNRIVLPVTEEERRYLTREDSIFTRGGQVLVRFLTSFPSSEPTQAGIISPMVGTLLVMLVTALTAVPLGIAAGIYLEEYARKNWFTTIIEINISNLAGVPSILYGLMALGLMVYMLHLGKSIATAGLTLAFLILPIVIVATREALRAIPQSIREAAYALGATRWQVIRHHLLPYATGGISTGVIIGLSRAIGETAPLITIGALTFIALLPPAPIRFDFPPISFGWLWSPFTVMPIQMFNWVSRPEQEFRVNAAAAGVILITLTLGLNAIAIWLRYRLRRRIKW